MLRALDLFGGREAVQQRITTAIRTRLPDFPNSDILQLEEALDLRQGTVQSILYDKASSLPFDVVLTLSQALGIGLSEMLGKPSYPSQEVRAAWDEMMRENPLSVAADGYYEEASVSVNRDSYTSLRAMADLLSDEGLESTVPEEFVGSHGEFDLNTLIEDKPFIEVIHGIRQDVITAFLKDPNLIRTLGWRAFEEFIAEIFDGLGFVVELTSPTKDGGRDIIAIKHEIARVKYLIECKQYDKSRPVCVDPVRSLLGVVASEVATKGILAATSGFTQPASDFIQTNYWRLEGRDVMGIQEWLRIYNRLRFGE